MTPHLKQHLCLSLSPRSPASVFEYVRVMSTEVAAAERVCIRGVGCKESRKIRETVKKKDEESIEMGCGEARAEREGW